MSDPCFCCGALVRDPDHTFVARREVKSSNVAAVGTSTGEIVVEFLNGDVWAYEAPPPVIAWFNTAIALPAGSAGRCVGVVKKTCTGRKIRSRPPGEL